MGEEDAFVKRVTDKATRYTAHSDMSLNSVFVHMDLYQLLEIDEKLGIVNIKVWLQLFYNIPTLAWDPEETNVSVVIVPPR